MRFFCISLLSLVQMSKLLKPECVSQVMVVKPAASVCTTIHLENIL